MEIRKRASSNCIPFIALTETWLKPYVHDAQLHIDGYDIHRCDRGTRVGGGVLLYTHQDLPITRTEAFDNDHCQLLMCTSDPSKLVICLLYHPPNSTHDSFKSCLDSAQSFISQHDSDYDVCLLGDFNFPNINWDPVDVCVSSDSSSRFVEFLSDNLMSQYILQPTRKDKILDLFITNSPSLVTHVIATDTKLFDHRLVEVFFSYNLSKPHHASPPAFESDTFRSLDFSKADFPKIREELARVDWKSLSEQCQDVDDLPARFSDTLFQICKSGCPMKAPPKSRKCNRKLNALSRKKRKLQQALQVATDSPGTPPSRIVSLQDKLSLLHYDIRDVIVQDRCFKENQAVSKIKSNSKYFYSYAKQFSKQKQSISMLYDEHNRICTNSKQIANILQHQFVSVFSDPSATDMNSSNFDTPDIARPQTETDLEFSVSDIIEAIDDMKLNAAPGPDGIPPVVLKECKAQLALPIHLIWSRSLDSSHVPQSYKNSMVTPLYKKGSRAIPANYRPVSLTSHVIKIFERVVRKKLVSHMTTNNLFCSKQHGFQSGKSCLTQLLDHFDEIITNFQNGLDTDCIYLDYAKAFDKVDHQLLLKKLGRYGVHQKLIEWIKSFLVGRNQQVAMNGHLSTAALILSGVPQGTVLGPILFLIFINDITACISNSTIRCFADDTKISRAISEESDMKGLQDDLNAVTEWSKRNNMTLHEDKFEYICHAALKHNTLLELPFTNDILQYSTSKGPLSATSQVKDLGVLVRDNLSWSPHIHSICQRARQKAAWVLSVFHSRRPDVILTLYKSMVRSLLEYCSPLWNPNKIGDIQELESVQKTITSKIAGCQDLNYWERLQKLSLMSLQRRRERFIMLTMWKILHGKTSNDLNIRFHERSRSGIQAVVPSISHESSAFHQSLYDSSFAVIGPKLWNCIPSNLNSIIQFDLFKKELTAFLMSVPDTPPAKGYSPKNSNSVLAWRMDNSASALWGGRRS